MKICIFTWKDIKNPNSGGAEVFTHEVAKRWVNYGHKVDLITSSFKNSHKHEVLDGVSIYRTGNFFTVYLKAPWLFKKLNNYNIVIDQINTRPFFANKFVHDGKVVNLVHELAKESWFYEVPFPVNYIGYYFLEPKWLTSCKNVPTITVSNSTKKELKEVGFNTVYTVPEGIDFTPFSKVPEKESKFTIIFLGLLKSSNLPEHAIEAFRLFSYEYPDSRLWIVGSGPLLNKLKNLSKNLDVKLLGYVDNEKKIELMARAHVIAVPAVKEGWGLVVTEANACGTPAVGYNVSGLCDSIKHNKTGILTNNNPESLFEGIKQLYIDNYLYKKLSINALEDSKNYNWDNCAVQFLSVLEDLLRE